MARTKLSWRGWARNFKELRYEAERELDKIASHAVDELNDASSWGGYHLHISNDDRGPGRMIGIANATSGRLDRVSRLLGGVKPKMGGDDDAW